MKAASGRWARLEKMNLIALLRRFLRCLQIADVAAARQRHSVYLWGTAVLHHTLSTAELPPLNWFWPRPLSLTARSAAKCPGGRDRYAGNAQSYLEVGESMGEAKLKRLPCKP